MPFAEYREASIDTGEAVLKYWTNDARGCPVVFLLHGAAMDHEMFEPQLDVLAGFHVVAWDARGHGKSRPVRTDFGLHDLARDCLAILDDCGGEQAAVLVGQSEGGMVAQEVYRRAPHRVRAIVTIGASPIMIPYSKWDVGLLRLSAHLLRLWPYRHLLKTIAANTAITKEAQAYAFRAAGNLSQQDFLRIWDGVTKAISQQGIPGLHIHVPLLITYGASDETGTVKKNNQRWKAYEPHARLAVIPEAGHNANQDNPARFNAILLDFLSSHGLRGIEPGR